MLPAPSSHARRANSGQRCSVHRSGTRTVLLVYTLSKHGPWPVCVWSASTCRGRAPEGTWDSTRRRSVTMLIEPSSQPGTRSMAARTIRSKTVEVSFSSCKDRARSASVIARSSCSVPERPPTPARARWPSSRTLSGSAVILSVSSFVVADPAPPAAWPVPGRAPAAAKPAQLGKSGQGFTTLAPAPVYGASGVLPAAFCCVPWASPIRRERRWPRSGRRLLPGLRAPKRASPPSLPLRGTRRCRGRVSGCARPSRTNIGGSRWSGGGRGLGNRAKSSRQRRLRPWPGGSNVGSAPQAGQRPCVHPVTQSGGVQ